LDVSSIFVNNRIDRVGQIYKNDILFYSGEIVNDKPHGLGTKYNSNNSVKHHGIFINGKFQDLEEEEKEDGEIGEHLN
jgi:antitoxin component YwqK of YwqJK toxin-antitoxin module